MRRSERRVARLFAPVTCGARILPTSIGFGHIRNVPASAPAGALNPAGALEAEAVTTIRKRGRCLGRVGDLTRE